MSRYRPVPYLPGEALLALYRRRGSVINSGIGRHGYIYLLGGEANKFVFANADAFSWRETFESLALVDGPTALIVSDGDDHRRRRSVVASGLRHRQIQDYVQGSSGDYGQIARDNAAWKEFMRRYQPKIRGAIFSVLKKYAPVLDSDAREDILQDFYLSLFVFLFLLLLKLRIFRFTVFFSIHCPINHLLPSLFSARR